MTDTIYACENCNDFQRQVAILQANVDGLTAALAKAAQEIAELRVALRVEGIDPESLRFSGFDDE